MYLYIIQFGSNIAAIYIYYYIILPIERKWREIDVENTYTVLYYCIWEEFYWVVYNLF